MSSPFSPLPVVCPNLAYSTPNATCLEFQNIACPPGTVMTAVEKITSENGHISSLTEYTCLGSDGATQDFTVGSQGDNSNPTSISSCPGGYTGFDYWAMVTTESEQPEGVVGIQFYCDGSPLEVLGRTGTASEGIEKFTNWYLNYFTKAL